MYVICVGEHFSLENYYNYYNYLCLPGLLYVCLLTTVVTITLIH